jgi:hypothetical protein
MKPYLLCAFLFLCLFSVPATSQKINLLEIEVGTNVSSLPHRGPLANGTETTLPVVSPLLGIWLTSWPDRRFTVRAGVQAFSRGQHYSYTRDGIDLLEYSLLKSLSFQYTHTEDMKFQAISPAVIATYSFRVKSIKAGITIGYRLLNYTTGQYLYTSHTTYLQDGGRDTYYEIRYNPFSDILFRPAEKTQSQISIGCRVAFRARWSIYTNYSAGGRLEFIASQPPNWCYTGYIHSYQRGDIGVSMRYRL